MNQKLKLIPAIIALSLMGCGGGGSASSTPDTSAPAPTSDTANGTPRNSVFMGMQGLQFATGNSEGLTDENGRYTYIEGQTITFKIGDIVLGSTAGKAKLAITDLAQGDAATEENLIRFLLTLDYDLAPMNGVLITRSIRELATGKQLNFRQSPDSFKREAETLLQTELASDLHVHAFRHSFAQVLPGVYREQNRRAARALTPFRYPAISEADKAAFADIDSEARQVFDLMLQDTVKAGDSPLEFIFKATGANLVLEGNDGSPQENGSLQDLYVAYKQRVQTIGPDAAYIEREDFVTRPASMDASVDVHHFVVMSDFQMRDDESPLSVNPVKFLIPSSYYPASPSIVNQVDDMVRTLREYETQQQKPIELAVFTGDFADISQYNEVRFGIDVLDGGLVNSDSGIDDDPIAGTFADGKPNDTYDAFDALGLNATRDGQDDIPWYYVAGNHDGLMLGNFPITDKPMNLFGKQLRGGTRELYDSISTGDKNWLGYDPSLLGFLEHLLDPASFTIPADADRRVMNPQEIASEMFNSTTHPHGHGMQHVIERRGNLDGRLHYAFNSENGLIRHIALDTNMPIGPEGWLDLYDIAWLKQELQAATTAGQLVIVSSHHKPSAIVLNGNLLVSTLNEFPNVLAHLVAHTHINNVRARPGRDAEHGYWEIESGSMVNWPQQFRVLDIQIDKESGVGVINSTMLNHETDSPLHVAQRGRFLAYLERYLEGAPDSEAALSEAEGEAEDRNARLYFKVSAGVLARL